MSLTERCTGIVLFQLGGPDTLEVAADLVSLAGLVDRNAAAAHLRRALAIYVRRLGPNSAQARGVRQKLASAGR